MVEKTLRYKNYDIRILRDDHQTLYVGKDICDALGIVNARDSIKRLREDGRFKKWVGTIQGERVMWVLNELGIYDFVLNTKKDHRQVVELCRWLLSKNS